MAGSIINIKILGDARDAKKAFDDAGKAGDGFGKKMSGIASSAAFGAISAGAVALTAVLVDATQAAIAEEASMQSLAQAMQQTLGATADQTAGQEAWIDSVERSVGISDQQLRPAMALLIDLGRSVSESHRDIAAATDLAAARGVDFTTAIGATTAAARGEADALENLGVQAKETDGSISSLDDISGRIADTMGGRAAEAATTAAGRLAILQVKADDLKETIGLKLIPVLEYFVDDLLPAMATEMDGIVDVVTAIGDGVGYVTGKVDSFADHVGSALDKATLGLTGFGDASDGLGGKVNELGFLVSAVGDSLFPYAHHIDLAAASTRIAARETSVLRDGYRLLRGELLLTAGAAAAFAGQITNSSALANSQRNTLGRFYQAPAARDLGEGVGSALGDGIGAGVEQSLSGGGGGGAAIKSGMDDVGNFLRALAQQQVEDLNDIYSGIGASLSFDRASRGVADARQQILALRAEAATLASDIAGQEIAVGRLAAEAVAITPEEQVAIEQATKELDRVKAAFEGLVETTTNPSSFAGESISSSRSGPAATLAEVQVAEQRLADARARAVGPTNALTDAQRKLADLRADALELPTKIAAAERDLVSAQEAVVAAQLRQVEAGRALADQGPEFIAQYRALAEQAGLAADEIDRLVANIGKSAAAAGLEDVFGNGQLFRSPQEAQQIRNFIRAQNGQPPGFADGGVVGGPRGSPQLIIAHGGETILPTHKGGVAMGGITINVSGAGDPATTARMVRDELLKTMRRNGGLGFN